MAKQKPTRESIIKAWKEADAKSDKPVGASEVATAMGISPYWIWKLFTGKSLTDMKLQLGIRLSAQERHLSDDELFSMLDKVVSDHGIPSWNLLNEKTGVPESTWKKRIGGRRGCSQQDVYRRYAEWLQAQTPNSPKLGIVTDFFKGHRLSEKIPAGDPGESSPANRIPSYPKEEGSREYGPVLHFSNLTLEPTREAGVVFLFGMVSKYLGFESIQYVGDDFPDCEAMCRSGSQHKLRRVRIEFEVKSSHFKEHGHDPQGCEFIVCWQHNWEECPSSLKVIELKKEIKGLRERSEFKL